MIKYTVDEQNNHLNIGHQMAPLGIWRQFKSIIVDIIMLIISLIAVSGFRYINDFSDVIIVITFILVFSIFQLINIYVNMRSKRFINIKMMTIQIKSMNIYFFMTPMVFISFGAPYTIYPFFLGAFLYSNVFNLLMQLSMNKSSFNLVNTYVDNNTTIVKTQSRLLGFSGNWTDTINHNGRPLKFRIATSKVSFLGFTKAAILSEENYLKFMEAPSSFIENNVTYSIHFINTLQSGKNLRVNKSDRIPLIGKTKDIVEILDLI